VKPCSSLVYQLNPRVRAELSREKTNSSVKKGTKEGTKEGTHPRLTFERAQRESSFRLALEGKATSKRTITVGAAAAAAN
jgi:hypothetical protein